MPVQIRRGRLLAALGLLSLPLLLSLAAYLALAGPVTLTDGPSSLRFDGSTAPDATVDLRPQLSNVRAIGLFVEPTLDPGLRQPVWPACFNLRLGTADRPVPAGVPGQLSGYEANLATAQRRQDQLPAESAHAFGATTETQGGAMVDMLDGFHRIRHVAADSYGLNYALAKEVPGGTQYGLNIQSAGPEPGTAAIHVTGPWTVGMDLSGLPLYRARIVTFADASGRNTPWVLNVGPDGQLAVEANGQAVAAFDAQGNLRLRGKVLPWR